MFAHAGTTNEDLEEKFFCSWWSVVDFVIGTG